MIPADASPTWPLPCSARERPGGYLFAHGGARFARSLVETGLIDEYRLMIHPAILGAGERLFLGPLTIEPVSTIAFSGGGRRPRLHGAPVTNMLPTTRQNY